MRRLVSGFTAVGKIERKTVERQNGAKISFYLAAKDFQKRSFTRTVVADQCEPALGVEIKIDIFEYGFERIRI